MPRTTYSRPIRDGILQRAALETRDLTSFEKSKIATEAASLGRWDFERTALEEEDERIFEHLMRFVAAQEKSRREDGQRKQAKADAVAEERDRAEIWKRRIADRWHKRTLQDAIAAEQRRTREKIREEIRRSGGVMSSLFAP